MEVHGLSRLANANNLIEEASAEEIEQLVSKIRDGRTATTDQHIAEFNRVMNEISQTQKLNLGVATAGKSSTPTSKPTISFPFSTAEPSQSYSVPRESSMRKKRQESVSSSSSDSYSESSRSGSSYSESVSSASSRSSDRRRNRHAKINAHTVNDAFRDINSTPSRENHVEREQLSLERMIQEIDIYSHLLKEMSYQGVIPEITQDMDYFQVLRIYNLVKRIADQKHYASLFEDILFAGSSFIETVLDGETKVFGKFPVNYRGLSSAVTQRMRGDKAAIASAVSGIAEQYGVNPHSLVLVNLLSPLITIPIKNYKDDKVNGNLNNPKTLGNLANYAGRN